MSTERPQQPSTPLVPNATDRPNRGRGRGRGRSRGRGHGRGRGGRSSFHQQAVDGAPVNVVDHQRSQAQSSANTIAEHAQEAMHGSSSAGPLPATDRRFAPQQQQQQYTAHSSQEARQLQPRQRSQRPRHRGPRHQNERAQHAMLGPAIPDSTAGLMLPHVGSLELPDCVICCEPLQVVAIGKCNHKSVCARCSLRLIMLYQDTKCPLCKADLEQVVMTHWTEPAPPDWCSFASKLRQLWHNTKWSSSIYVDDASFTPSPQGPSPQGAPSTGHLHSHLQRMSARACSICDPQAHRPFPSNDVLSKHVSTQHHRHMCPVCLNAQRSFPLELPLFASQRELQAHLGSAHSLCSFCNRHFFSAEELWMHVHDNHFTCQLCLRHGAQRHFAAAQHLTEHLRREHFLCEEELCQDCFVGFDSLQQLQEHHRHFHSQSMPRWDPSRARHVPLSEIFPDLGPSQARPTMPAARATRVSRGGAAEQRLRADASGPTQLNQPHRNGPAPPGPEVQLPPQQGEGGMTMIDDDYPPMAGQSAAPQQSAAPGPGLQPREAFPDLAAAAAASGSDQEVPAQQRHRRQVRPLVKVTVKCPCGRRVSHQVMQEGQRPAALLCDAACVQAGRQQQLAGAFGVEDPSHHVSSFDRNRTASYSPLLLTHAWSNKEWVQTIEHQLAGFLSAKGSKRQSLPAMPRHQREVVHALAQQYGLASSSYKPEPGRYVELFKLPASSIPNKLLSETVRGMTHEDIISLARAAHGHPLKLTDLRQDVDVEWFLKQWDGQYNTEWQSSSEVVVRFTTPQALKEALTALGGGIRGVFRVDRGWAPLGVAPQSSTSQATTTAASSSRQPTSSSHRATSTSSDWQTVKTSGSRAKGRGPPAGPSNGPSTRAASACASASPLDFQEPWKDEPEQNTQNRHSPDTNLQHKQRQTVAPAVSEDELPEDWEEAASAIESSDGGLEEAAAPAEAVPEAAAAAVDEAYVDEHSAETASRSPSDSSVTDGTQDGLSVLTLAYSNQAEAAAAASPVSEHTARGEAEAASAAATSHTNEGTAEAVSPADGSQEGASVAGLADERQESLAVAAQQSETSAGVADAALLSASAGMLQSMLVLSEPQAAIEATVASSAEPASPPHHLAVPYFSAAPEEDDAHSPAADRGHASWTTSQAKDDNSLPASGEQHHSEHCTGGQKAEQASLGSQSSFSLSAEASRAEHMGAGEQQALALDHTLRVSSQ